MKRINPQSNRAGMRSVEATARQQHQRSVVTETAASTHKRRKLQERASVDIKQRDDQSMDIVADVDFPKLDQSNPEHARRIQQRRRMVAFGKNTVGYDEYVKKIPKDQRRQRCMKHPSTPDHTLDIPTKRWQGLIRAWRRALHQYDPPDMMKALTDEAPNMDVDEEKNVAAKMSVKALQITEAAANGLPVVIQDSKETCSYQKTSSPSSLATFVSSDTNEGAFVTQNEMEELDVWEQNRANERHLSEDDDSDDDLL